MPISTLDARTALIVIDLQNGIVALPTAHSTVDVIKQSSALAAAFRAKNLPAAPDRRFSARLGRSRPGARPRPK